MGFAPWSGSGGVARRGRWVWVLDASGYLYPASGSQSSIMWRPSSNSISASNDLGIAPVTGNSTSTMIYTS